VWVVSDIIIVVSVAAGGVVVCSIPCSPSVPVCSVFLLQPSANRSAHVNTRTRVTANIFFIPLSPPSNLRFLASLLETAEANKAKHHCWQRCLGEYVGFQFHRPHLTPPPKDRGRQKTGAQYGAPPGGVKTR